MLMVIDVGNTETIIGVYNGDEFLGGWRMGTNVLKTSDEISTTIRRFLKFDKIDKNSIKDVIVSSVVPPMVYTLTRAIEKSFFITPMFVNYRMQNAIKVNMENPKELGNDRIVKMYSAWKLYGGPVMVVDYSTATTFDVVDKEGNFITGITAPGINVCTEALFSKTAQLPKIEIIKPESIYCADIVSCIQSGIYYGHRGEAKYIINRVKEETGFTDLKIVATGGMARAIDENNDIFHLFDTHLIFKGLRMLYEENKENPLIGV